MRIIFDSEEEKRELAKNYCPSDIGLENRVCKYGIDECVKCWERAVKTEIKDNTKE